MEIARANPTVDLLGLGGIDSGDEERSGAPATFEFEPEPEQVLHSPVGTLCLRLLVGPGIHRPGFAGS